jgi:murein DD-endopeptidase MepM/ murein hydrolase activator NlpD
MTDSSDTIDAGSAACGVCYGPVGGKRYVQAEEASLTTLCSEKCLRIAQREQSMRRWAVRRRNGKRLAIVLIFVGACLTPHQGPRTARLQSATVVQPPAKAPAPPPLPPGWFGPDWPPTEMSLLAALGRDAWVHPLPGPYRRMPRTDARVFGAVRPGDRAVECRNGHCGVDLGGEIWGEHVYAVHDGVVEWVQRGPNANRGGQFVKLSHRQGTVITQYFHLAAIPRGLERGVAVKAGDVVGLLGDTGVKESAPHLHFSISIQPSKDWPEKYIDPEPLLALWPLRVPVGGTEVGLVTTVAQAGVPLGSMPLRHGHKAKLARKKRGSDPSARSERSGLARKKAKVSAVTEELAEEEPSEPEAPTPMTEEE